MSALSLFPQVVSRVLGGGVANRWSTRLQPVAAMMEDEARARHATRPTTATTGAEGASGDDAMATAAAAAASLPPGAAAGDDDDDGLAGFFAYAARHYRQRSINEMSGWPGLSVVGPREMEIDEMSDAAAFEAVRQQCTDLCSRSQRFCAREVDILHSALVAEQRRAGSHSKSERVQRAVAAEDLPA